MSIENKNDKNVFIFKLSQDLIQIKIKITLDDNYHKTVPLVDLVENKYESILIDKSLIQNINKEIIKWQEQEKLNTYDNNTGMLERLIVKLLKIIENARWQIEYIYYYNL